MSSKKAERREKTQQFIAREKETHTKKQHVCARANKIFVH